MRNRLLTCLTLVPVLVAMAGFVPRVPDAQSKSAGFEIDGRVEPNSIPQWLLWEMSFSTLDTAKRRDLRSFTDSLTLSPAEGEALYKEAAGEETRLVECHKGWDQQLEMLRSGQASEQKIAAQLREATIACRQKTLDARDRVLSQLSPEARDSLLSWVSRMRSDIRYLGSAEEKEYFWLPE
jgi:hypothetical protein